MHGKGLKDSLLHNQIYIPIGKLVLDLRLNNGSRMKGDFNAILRETWG